MRNTTMNRPPERENIQDTSFIEGNPQGRMITAEDKQIIGAQSRLDDLCPEYDSEGASGLNLQISRTKYPGKIVVIEPKGGESEIFNKDMSVRKNLPKFVKQALGPSRQELIGQNQVEIDRQNAEREQNEAIANKENEGPAVRKRAREKAQKKRSKHRRA